MNPSLYYLVCIACALLISCGQSKVEDDGESPLTIGFNKSQEAVVRVGDCLAVQYAAQHFVTFSDCLTDGNLWKQDAENGWKAYPYSVIRTGEGGIAFLETDFAVSPTSLDVRFFSDYPFKVSLQVPGKYSNCEADYESHKCHTEKGFRGAPLVRNLNGEPYLIGINQEPEFQAADAVKVCPGGCEKRFLNAEEWMLEGSH
jgi:hypothetical protein